MRGSPEPSLPIVRRLQAENPLVPVGIMRETNIFDLEILLSLFPFFRPSKMGFVELLAQFGNFNRIGRRKENSKRIANHLAIPWASRITCDLRLALFQVT